MREKQGRVPNWVIEEAAHIIASDMVRRANYHCWRFDEPKDLEKLARSYGARVESYKAVGGDPGWYHPGTQTIAYNELRTYWNQCRTLVHEIGHHIAWTWCPPQLRGAVDCYRYDDNPLEVHHRIARVLEGLVL